MTGRFRVIACVAVNVYVIYQTRETVFHQNIQTPRRAVKIERAAEYFFTIFIQLSILVYKKETFFILQNMFRHSYLIFSCKCSTVFYLNFHCILV